MARNILLVITLLTITILQACVIDDEDIVNPTDPRAKFLGDWNVTEDCTRSTYEVTISIDPGNSTQVLVQNFAGAGWDNDPAVALVVSNTIKVSSQNIGVGWTVSGQGSYQTDGTIQWNYKLVISGVTENCTAVFYR